MRGLPWYIVLTLTLATWAVMLAVAWLARRFRRPRLTGGEVTAIVGQVRDDIAASLDEHVPCAVLPAESSIPAQPYRGDCYAVGDLPATTVSPRDDGHPD